MRVLVATDVAARGLDIEALPFVVNYDLPHNPEDYVHRIGRTGRAGASGEAISLVSETETRYLKDIEQLLGNAIETQIVPGFEPGAAEVPAYQPRSPRVPSTRAAFSPKPSSPGSSPFDAPYVPSDTPRQANPTPARRASKQVAALFRAPVAVEVETTADEAESGITP